MPVASGGTMYFKFTTRDAGVPATLGGTPAVSVYKNNSTTESAAGVTLVVDFDSVTGLNHVTVDTSADGTFYSAGSHFDLVITAGTVGGNSVVGEVVGTFELTDPNSVVAGVNVLEWLGVTPDALSGGLVQALVGDYASGKAPLQPTTAGRTLDVSAGGEAGLDWANIGSPTTSVALTGTTITPAKVTKNVALPNFTFPMNTPAGTPPGSVTVTASISKDGAAFTGLSGSPTITYMSDGVTSSLFKVSIAQADMNADIIALRFTAIGCIDTNILIKTQ